MESPGTLGNCPRGSDNQFGPRVNTHCRPFDFTLFFEDAIFIALPAAVLLLLAPMRLKVLWKAPVKVTSRRTAVWKLTLQAFLFTVNIVFLVFRTKDYRLYTALSVASATLSTAAIVVAALLSFLEDQRSLKPSDLLVLYFSTTAIVYSPVLRSLWLIPQGKATRALWTMSFLGSILAVFVESSKKTASLRIKYSSVAKEQTVSLWNLTLFAWVLPFFRVGYSKVIRLKDIPDIDDYLQATSASESLHGSWRSTKKGRFRLIRATFKANSWLFLFAVPPRLALSAFLFCQPFIVSTSIKFLENKSSEEYHNYYGPALVGATVLTYLGIAMSRALYWRQTNRMLARFRTGLISIVYQHIANLQSRDTQDAAVVTLMGTDVERIVQSTKLVHEIWASLIEIGIGIWLLARQISWASVVPLVVCLVSLAMASVVARHFGTAQRLWAERVEKRITVTANLLGSIKVVKMLSMTDTMSRIISDLRRIELKGSEKFRKLLVSQILIGNIPTMTAPFVTFAFYVVVTVVSGDGSLLSAQAFASLALISLVTNSLLQFCQALPSCLQASGCFGRIQDFVTKEPSFISSSSSLVSSDDDSQNLVILQSIRMPQGAREPLISLRSASVAYSRGSDVVLKDLDLAIRPGFTAIIGPVASGKSAILLTLLGEMTLKKGSVTPAHIPGAAYCSQAPWITDDTIRRNITGHGDDNDIDKKRYDFSIWSCGLQEDVARLPQGDLTVAGSNGSSLSGGQRQRMALARAVYSKLEVVILDDVMSGLDSGTANMIISRLFGPEGHFRRIGISVVLATHNASLLSYMDETIVLQNGTLLSTSSTDISRAVLSSSCEDTHAEYGVGALEGNISVEGVGDIQIDAPSATDDTRQERRLSSAQKGILQAQNSTWSVYVYYCRSAGTVPISLWVFCTIVGAVLNNVSTIWLEKWTKADERGSNETYGYYLGIYALLVVIANAGVAGECWFFFINIINDTALRLHNDLLRTTLSAPYSFFKDTDVGAVTNRFSQDMDLIDMTLPSQAIQFTTGAASCVTLLVILCVLAKYLAATIPVFAAVLFLLQRYYLRTSRQVRLVDIEAKSPLYKLFIETVAGISTIRSYFWEPVWTQRFQEVLKQAQRPYYMLLCIQQWLSIVLDLIVGSLAVITVAIALLPSTDALSAGSLGVALNLILEFNTLLAQAIQSWTKLETSIGAVARVQQFTKNTPLEPESSADQLTPPAWPQKGMIQFHQVCASYGSNAPPALADFSLEVRGGEKIALCGPSGSGKSSLVLALLGMVELREGQITIDDVLLSSISGKHARSRINVIPQETFFLPGTVRLNLDPKGQCPDDAIEAAIRKVGLQAKVSAGGGLDMELSAPEWSQGEKQLLSLARALLVPSKILILDEATSSLDEDTESAMQRIIETEFRDHTIISVLHRLKHIRYFDRVAVLKEGRLVECGPPQTLLETTSALRALYVAQHVE